MKKDGKKYIKSKVAVVCYVLSALMLIYTCYQIGSTVATINEYYAQYDMKAAFGEYFMYITQNALSTFISAVTFFMLAYILDTVRRADPANWLSPEEIEERAIAKKQAREARQIAKGEKAAAKAGIVTTDEKSVEADFTESLNAELKAAEAAPEFEPANPRPARKQNRKPSGSRNQSGKQESGKSEVKQDSSKSEVKQDSAKSESKQDNAKSEGKQDSGKSEGGRSRNSGSRQPRNNSSRNNQNRSRKKDDKSAAETGDGKSASEKNESKPAAKKNESKSASEKSGAKNENAAKFEVVINDAPTEKE